MLRLSSGSCMLRLGLGSSSALDHACSGSGSGSGSASEEAAASRLSTYDAMLRLSPSLSMHEPLLSLSMRVFDPNHLE